MFMTHNGRFDTLAQVVNFYDRDIETSDGNIIINR